MFKHSHRAYTYRVTELPAVSPIALELFKLHIKRKVSNTTEDVLLEMYLKGATGYAEKLMRRDLITRTYMTFRDFFPVGIQNEGYYPAGYIPNNTGISTSEENIGFEIRRSPLQTVDLIQYYVSGVLTTVAPSVYYNTIEEDYSEILTTQDNSWPTDADNRMQAIQITFKCGMGDNDKTIPHDIRNAILEHTANLWANRGDCSDSNCDKTVPPTVKGFYLQNRIENL